MNNSHEMAEEPSLPRLPAVSWDLQSQSISNNPKKRARNQLLHAPPSNYNSSDPAIFSSDDDPALDNYVEGRRKKRYIGSWFQQHPTSSDSTFSDAAPLAAPQRKRTFARQADSGVFLGSDGNESDDMLDHLAPPKPRLPQLDRPAVKKISQAEQAAREKVQTCLEKGLDKVDFWSMGLEELSNDTIAPLANLSHIPIVAKDVAFEHKDPELQLHMAMNRLMWVPGALFELTNLTMLTLRNNKLRDIPSCVSNLHNLRELNVSQNKLRHLPIELLDLFSCKNKLRTLIIHPNPFFKKDPGMLSDKERWPKGQWPLIQYEYDQGDALFPAFLSHSLGRSPLQLSNTSGRILSNFRLPVNPSTPTLPVESEPTKHNHGTGHVPSLLEVVLRNCYKSSLLNDMSSYIPDGLRNLRTLLERAIQQKERGGLRCSRCRKHMVVPVVEWVEWREIKTTRGSHSRSVSTRPLSKAEDERAVPFLHRGCSWGCGPRDTGKEDVYEMPEGYPPPSRTISTWEGH